MQDDPFRGILLMLAATVLFTCSDVMAKYVTQSIPAVELLVIRYAVFVAIAGAPFLRSRRLSMRSRRPWLQLVRGVGVAGSAVFFVLSLRSLPVPEASAINFVSPLLITVLAVPVLGEVVRPAGWAAVAAGFLGVLVVVRPGLGGLHPAAGLVLLSSLFWCVAMLVTRRMAGNERSDVTLLWTAITGFGLMLCALPFFLAPLDARQLGFCVLVGIVATGGQWCALLAYRQARASVLAPLSYTQLLWAAALGFAVFGTVPDAWVIVGAAIIAASGVVIVQLERHRVAAR